MTREFQSPQVPSRLPNTGARRLFSERFSALWVAVSVVVHVALLALALARTQGPAVQKAFASADVEVDLVELEPEPAPLMPEPPPEPEPLAVGTLSATALDAVRPPPKAVKEPPPVAAPPPAAPPPAALPPPAAAVSALVKGDPEADTASPQEAATEQSQPGAPGPLLATPTAAADVAMGRSPTEARFGVSDGAVAAGPSDAAIARLLKEWHRRVQRHLAARALGDYPRRALRDRLQGTAQVSVVIGASGAVGTITLAQSSGHDILDRAALMSLKSIRTVPPPPAEVAWRTRAVRIPVRYRLQ